MAAAHSWCWQDRPVKLNKGKRHTTTIHRESVKSSSLEQLNYFYGTVQVNGLPETSKSPVSGLQSSLILD